MKITNAFWICFVTWFILGWAATIGFGRLLEAFDVNIWVRVLSPVVFAIAWGYFTMVIVFDLLRRRYKLDMPRDWWKPRTAIANYKRSKNQGD